MIIIYTNLSKGDGQYLDRWSTTQEKICKQGCQEGVQEGEQAPNLQGAPNLRNSLKFSNAPSKLGRVNDIKIKTPFKGILIALGYCPPVFSLFVVWKWWHYKSLRNNFASGLMNSLGGPVLCKNKCAKIEE